MRPELRLALNGATGNMGREVARLARDGGWNIVCESSGRSFGDCAQADVWIDFSAPESTMRLLERIEAPIVIGTTGFSEQQMECIREYSDKASVLVAANMSFGVELLRRMLKQFPNPGFGGDVSILEQHHRFKRDMPSGTARVLEARLHDRGFENVPIHSVRAGGIVGVHEVRWVCESEEIILTHRAFDRSVFARGALRAADWLVSKKRGLFGISDVWEAA